MKKLFVKFVHVFIIFTMVLWSVAPGLGAWINTVQAEEFTPTETPIVESAVAPVVEPTVTPAVEPVVEQAITATDEIVAPVTEEETAPAVDTVPTEEVITPDETVPAESVVVEESQPVPSAWANDGNNKNTTTNIVEIGKTYTSPQNDQVTVTFTTLPENPGKLSIEEITLTAEQIASLGALSDKAYDITSDMTDGTFTFDLNLPKPVNQENVQIKFAETEAGLENADTVATSDITTETTDSVSASLDHFTIFVVVMPSEVLGSLCVSASPNCYTTIQSAIDAASPNDTINVAAGIYTEQVTITKSLNLIGAGETTTTILAPATRTNSVVHNGTTHDYLLVAYATSSTIDVRVEGFTIDVGSQNKTAGTTRIDGVFFRDVKDAGGSVAGLFSSTIHNFATTPDYEAWGAAIYGDSILTINDNDISDYTRDGLLVVGGNITISSNTITGSALPLNGINIQDVTAGSVTGNTVTGNTRTGDAPCPNCYAAGGMVVWTSTGMTISGNHINGNFYGINLQDSSHGITISGNELTNNIKRGITLDNSDDNTVKGNTINGPAAGTDDVAIGLVNTSTNNTIGGPILADGNTITMATSGTGNLYAVHMQSDVGAGTNTIKYNTITGGQRAVQFDGPPGITGLTTVANNIISSQEFGGIIAYNNGNLTITDNTLTNAVRPMEFQGAVNVTISGNTINGSVYDGINAGSASGTVKINGNNKIYNIADNQYGIHVQSGVDNIEIDGNEIYSTFNGTDVGAHSLGIGIDSGATGAKITNNNIHNNSWSAISLNEVVNTITGNTINANARGIEASANFTANNKNKFTNNLYCSACISPLGTYNLAGNWWGTSYKSSIENQIPLNNGNVFVTNISYAPYYIDSGLLTLSDVAVNTAYVDDNYTDGSSGGHIFGYDAFATIQAGIDAAASGGTVNVAAGTYIEQILIQKDLILTGAGIDQTIVKAPTSDRTHFHGHTAWYNLDGSSAGDTGWTSDYILAAYPTDWNGLALTGTPISVKVTGFTFDANNQTYTTGAVRFTGVFFGSVKGTDIGDAGLFSSEVKGFPVAMGAGTGVRILGDSKLTIDHNTVGYTVNGIASYGDASTAADPVVAVSYNTVNDVASVTTNDEAIALAAGATGTIDHNTIANGNSGIGLYGAGNGIGSTVSNNTISNLTADVSAGGAGILISENATGNTITGNSVTNSALGILVGDGSSNNTFTGNTITNNTNGVQVKAYEGDAGSTVPIGLVFHNNDFSGNTTKGFDNKETTLVDATNNWWGSASGPLDNKGLPGTPNYDNPLGTGNPVSSFVDYNPWFIDTEPMTTLSNATLTSVDLGSAASYGVLSNTYTNTSAATRINGDVGFTSGPVSVAGTHTNYGSAGSYSAAGTAQATALNSLNNQACTLSFTTGAVVLSAAGTQHPSSTYTPGVYCINGAVSIGTTITLSGVGTYTFRSTGALDAEGSSIVTLDGASANDVFWTPNGATTLNVGATFIGTVIPVSQPITVLDNVSWIGRALTFGSTVTTGATDTITVPGVVATFALTYTAGANGSIDGTTPQTVNYGADGTLVTATPALGYHFVSWDDGVLTAARTDSNVQANISATASFAINTFTFTRPAKTGSGNGIDEGTTPGTINYGTNVSVIATADSTSSFTNWIATGSAASRDGSSVSTCSFTMTGDASVQANYTLITLPVMTGTVAIDGTAQYGETLTANISQLTNAGNPTYIWNRNWNDNHEGDIPNITTSTYLLDLSDIGKTIFVTVTAESGVGTGYKNSSPTSIVPKIDQATLLAVATPGTVVYGSPSTLSTTGGSVSGAITYSAGESTGCSITNNILSVINASGTCSVTATMAGNGNYNPVSSSSTAITINKASQATLTTTAQTVTYPTTFAALATTGGSGTGAVTYAVTSAGTAGCSISGGALVYTSAGTCTVTATMAADTNYSEISSVAQTFTIEKATQTALVTTAQTVTYPTTFVALATTGGSGTGAVTYAVTSAGTAGCSISGGALVYTSAGTCTVTATMAADTNYSEISSVAQTFTVEKRPNSSGGRSNPATPAIPAKVETPDGCAAGNKFSTTTGRNCNTATPAVPAGQVLGASTQAGQVLGAEKFNFIKFMKNGSNGNEIMELQKFLNTLGYTLVADGKFGPKTKGAVIKFQIANGLKGDGVIGPLTRAVLNK